MIRSINQLQDKLQSILEYKTQIITPGNKAERQEFEKSIKQILNCGNFSWMLGSLEDAQTKIQVALNAAEKNRKIILLHYTTRSNLNCTRIPSNTLKYLQNIFNNNSNDISLILLNFTHNQQPTLLQLNLYEELMDLAAGVNSPLVFRERMLALAENYHQNNAALIAIAVSVSQKYMQNTSYLEYFWLIKVSLSNWFYSWQKPISEKEYEKSLGFDAVIKYLFYSHYADPGIVCTSKYTVIPAHKNDARKIEPSAPLQLNLAGRFFKLLSYLIPSRFANTSSPKQAIITSSNNNSIDSISSAKVNYNNPSINTVDRVRIN